MTLLRARWIAPLLILMTVFVLGGCAQEPPAEDAPGAVTPLEHPEVVFTPDEPAPPAAPVEAPDDVGASEAADEASVSMTMTREAMSYEPGGAVEIMVTLDYDGEDPVTALAIEETLPPGWRFGIASDGALPALSPETGHTETFALVWIDIPDFPMTVHYIIDAPNDAEGTATLTGQAVYRKLAGELRTPMLDTALLPAE